MGRAGKREYVQVLRLLESFRLAEVEAAIGDALKLGATGFDAVTLPFRWVGAWVLFKVNIPFSE